MPRPELIGYIFAVSFGVLIIFLALKPAKDKRWFGRDIEMTDDELANKMADLRESARKRQVTERTDLDTVVEPYQKAPRIQTSQRRSEGRRTAQPTGFVGRLWKPALPRPRGAWKIFARTSVAGTRHRIDEVERFLSRASRADPAKVGFDLQPDPENRHDKHAIGVYGYVGGQRFHLGFVPADLAKELAQKAPPEMPLSAHLQRVFRGDHAADITFHILVPAQRNDFWKSRENPFSGPAGAKAVWTGLQSDDTDDESG